jgi:hypothetical protein
MREVGEWAVSFCSSLRIYKVFEKAGVLDGW